MQIRCVHCSALGNVPHTALHKNVRCPKCEKVFTVTGELAARGSDRRRAERVEVEDVDLDFGIIAGTAEVVDLSLTGVGFEPPEADMDFNKGDVACFTLLNENRPLLENVHVRITRRTSTSFGGEFENLSELQLAEIRKFLAQQRYKSSQKQADEVDIEIGGEPEGPQG